MSDQALLAPHSQEAEECVIGSVLINPNYFGVISGFLSATDFYILRNAWIWEAMQDLYDRNEPIEYVTVVSRLRGVNRLEQVGGIGYLSYTVSKSATAMHAETYGQIVLRTANRRRALEMCNAMALLARDENTDWQTVLDQINGVWDEFAQTVALKGGLTRSLSDLIPEYYATLAEEWESGVAKGAPSSMVDVQQHLGSYVPGSFYIVGADSGGGKSAFALTEARHAIECGKRVLYINCEMTNADQLDRMVVSETGLDSIALRQRQFDQEELDRVGSCLSALAADGRGDRLHLADLSGASLGQIQSAILTAKAAMGGLDMVVIDHLQLIQVPQSQNIAQTTDLLSNSMKSFAKRFDIALLGLIQFNANSKLSASVKPDVNNLWGGPKWRQAADAVMLIHRPDMYDDSDGLRANEADIYFAKLRYGQANKTVTVNYDAERVTFRNLYRGKI